MNRRLELGSRFEIGVKISGQTTGVRRGTRRNGPRDPFLLQRTPELEVSASEQKQESGNGSRIVSATGADIAAEAVLTSTRRMVEV